MLNYPGVILHAVGTQIRFFFNRGCGGQHRPMSAFTAFPLQFCTALENVLYTVTVRRMYEYFLLQLIKIYGFCEDERPSVFCHQFLFACRPFPGLLDVFPE